MESKQMAHSTRVPLLESSKKYGKNESPWTSVLNMCNVAIGAGVLSFPYGFRQTGLLGGFLLTGCVWVVQIITLCVLIRVTEKYNSQSYQELVHTVLGPQMAVVSSLVMFSFLFGANVSYHIITGDVFEPIFIDIFGENSIFANRNFVLILFGLVVILPLSLQRTLKALRYSSVLSVTMLSYLAIALISIGVAQLVTDGFPKGVLIFKAGIGAFITLDIVVFAFETQIQVVSIFAELTEHPHPFFKAFNKDQLQDEETPGSEIPVGAYRSERVKRMDGVIFLSMTICFTLFTSVGIFGYLLFQDVESDVLKSFGNSNIFMNFARVGMAVVAMVCYPVQLHPARSFVADAIKNLSKLQGSDSSLVRHVLITVGYFSATLGIALSVTDLGKVFSIVGSTGGVMAMFIIPGTLLFMGSHNISPRGSGGQACTEVFGGTCIVVVGVIMFIATVYVTITGMPQ
ncbi:unnamed protein product [Calypogeia fissa]